MKTFRYPLGHKNFDTMTVGELMEKLRDYPADMPVLATWEGTINPIKPEGFESWMPNSKYEEPWCMPEDNCECALIDVDGHW